MHPERQFYWVVRSVGERTTAACAELFRTAARGMDVKIIEVAPFVESVRQTWSRGQQSGRPWTVCVDADVLVRPHRVRELLAVGLASAPSVFSVQGLILDKLIPTVRPSGVRLYRNEYADLARQHIPRVAEQARPETYTNQRLLDRGLTLIQTDLVCGLHDFEQDYDDLYRTGLVHAHKHGLLGTPMWDNWTRRATYDRDIAATLLGARAAAQSTDPLRIDVRYDMDRRRSALQQHGFAPKAPLANISPAWVERQLDRADLDPALQRRRYPDWSGSF